MFVLGLTGGIASGKSTVARILADRIPVVIDADEVSREIMAPGGQVYDQLVGRFGTQILRGDAIIDRVHLGRLVFCDKDALQYLNALTHPPIIATIKERITALRDRPDSPEILLLRVPLLVEVGLTDVADYIVVVVADEDTRAERIVKYRGLSIEEARHRIAAQMPDAEKVKFADYVIDNNGTLNDLERQTEALWFKIKHLAMVHNG